MGKKFSRLLRGRGRNLIFLFFYTGLESPWWSCSYQASVLQEPFASSQLDLLFGFSCFFLLHISSVFLSLQPHPLSSASVCHAKIMSYLKIFSSFFLFVGSSRRTSRSLCFFVYDLLSCFFCRCMHCLPLLVFYTMHVVALLKERH